MKASLVITRIIFVVICIAILAVNYKQENPSTALGILGLAGVIVALVHVYIKRQTNKRDQD